MRQMSASTAAIARRLLLERNFFQKDQMHIVLQSATRNIEDSDIMALLGQYRYCQFRISYPGFTVPLRIWHSSVTVT